MDRYTFSNLALKTRVFKQAFCIFLPNPAYDFITLTTENGLKGKLEIKIFDVTVTIVKFVVLKQNQQDMYI